MAGPNAEALLSWYKSNYNNNNNNKETEDVGSENKLKYSTWVKAIFPEAALPQGQATNDLTI